MAGGNAASQPFNMEAKSNDAKSNKKAAGKAHAKTAGAGAHFMPPQAQVLQTVQVPRRFPGHFMPHRLCNHWNLQGWCKKAETCTFAHGIQELHPDVQAQLLQQKPGMPPPSVTKDGRLVVHGVSKPAGKVESVGYPMPMPDVYGSTNLLGSGLLNTNFGFDLTGTQIPPPTAAMQLNELPELKETADDAQEPARARSTSPGTPSKRRPAPAPLSLDDLSLEKGKSSVLAMQNVYYAGMRPLGSPMRVSVVSRPLPSPISTGFTPTGATTSVATSVAMAAISTPKTGTAQVPSLASPARVTTHFPTSLASPARVTAHFTRSPTGGLMWPGSPTMVSPTGKPSTPVPIDRSTLLQARQVAVRMDQGPPGLAMWAPTPTTKANLLGFRYPEPGYMAVAPRTPGA
ncbi:unnamed protein product [Symbiodinium natans]|uniref:C3H1-type domain-containing protein n=1 Tax=Symbiodinium natans TaxID=878477 RepID=A0A812I2D7_9DINO|nr:unnamed protein product [Symbiodinium natans]